MDWVKKNLIFVATLAVAVALLAYGVFFFLGKKTAAEEADAQLQSSTQSLEQLYQRDPFPSEDNIRAAREQQERLSAFRTNASQRFPRGDAPEGADSAAFKALLESSIAGLEREAERFGVKLPQKFNFTFKDQREKFQLAAAVLPTLTVQLMDVDRICRLTFAAKVNEVLGFRRSPVDTNEVAGAGGASSPEDFLSKKISTNQTLNAAIYPYEISFTCFSPELASVLAGLANSPQAILVKTINVERPEGSGAELPNVPMAGAYGGPYGGRMDPILAQRYGLGRYGRMPSPAASPVPQPVARPNAPVLDEKPLKVTLGIEVVRMLPVKAAAPAGRTPAPVAKAAPAE